MKTFEQILDIEPRLKTLKSTCEDLADRGDFTIKSRIWYRVIKQDMKSLVGWFAEREEMRSSDYYDTVYKKLIDILKV